MRDERRENERYRHASLLDQVRDEAVNLAHQPKVLLVIGIIVGGWIVLTIATPSVVKVEQLRVGDCIYVPTSAGGQPDTTRPIGQPGEIVAGLMRAGAERSSCDMSHSHEVAGVFVLPEPAGAAYPGDTVLTTRQGAACAAAFESYVGHPVAGSTLELTIAVPGASDWDAGRRAGACLVSNADGTYLSARAGGSAR